MIRLLFRFCFWVIRTAIFILVVLLLGQMPLGEKTLGGYVQGLLAGTWKKTPIPVPEVVAVAKPDPKVLKLIKRSSVGMTESISEADKQALKKLLKH